MSYKSKIAYTPKHNIVTNFLLYLFFITPSNWTEAISWEIIFCILLIYVQGAILDSPKALKIITFRLILSAVFP